MFNSQKINNDPEPYVGWSGKRYEDSTYPSLEDGPVSNEPRPEYDNNPNPILVEFRNLTHRDAAGVLRQLPSFYTPHIDHARRVLEKLVNVYG